MDQSNYDIYNRYSNISARGPCIDLFMMKKRFIIEDILGTRTAVRLIGEHRHHDYINANQIKVIEQ